jgi:phytoene desaturase
LIKKPIKAVDMFSLLDMTKMFFKMVPLMPYIQKYSAMTIKEFAEQLKHPLLQQALQSVVPNKYSSIAVFFTLSSLDSGDSGWPAGGSRRLCGRMEQKYLSLGGKIHYRSKIEKIRIEEGKATGVILTDGGERSGDYIISAADGYFTLQNMLEGKYLDGKLKKLYSDGEAYPIYTTVQVSLGIACDLSKEPHMLFFKPSHEINAGGITHERIGLKHFCYDGSIAPQGKSIITVLMDADYDWWQEGYKNKETYKAEKERIAKEVCNAIEERYPATKGKIESVDVATPMTYVRYCNAWRGAWMSWMTTLKGRIRYLPGNLKRLDNFYMTGQWTMPPGGLPGAVITGKWTIQRICKLLKYKFKTAV